MSQRKCSIEHVDKCEDYSNSAGHVSDCGCCRHDHSCREDHHDGRASISEILAGAVLFAAGLAVNWLLPVASAGGSTLATSLYLAAYVVSGWRVLFTAASNIRRGRVFDENSLMALASIGAVAIAEYPEAVAVMLFYSVGERLQHSAVARSRRSIEELISIRPDRAWVFRRGTEPVEVTPDEVMPGEELRVRPGERVPLDGVIVDGQTTVDTSALTGESMPRVLEVGDKVSAGVINLSATVRVLVEKSYSESTVSRILSLVQQASERKAHTEQFISKFARYYTPAVVGVAAAVAMVPPLVMEGQSFIEWLHRALTILVISCPCALVLSVPLSYFAGIGGASRRGVLVKGANYLEALNDVGTVVFDKTGTLTQGSFSVVEVVGSNGFTEHDVMDLAAHAGSQSNHPLSASIRKAYTDKHVLDTGRVQHVQEISGMGVSALVDGKPVIAGNDRLLHRENVAHDACVTDGTVVNVARDRVLAGRIRLADKVKPRAGQAVSRLKAAGVHTMVMLTGDTHGVAADVARDVGIDQFHAGLLPQEKVKVLENIINQQRAKPAAGAPDGRRARRLVAFAGDGINDAPALVRADVGIAMGALGSDAAIEAADVVVMDDDPSRIADAIEVARRTRRIVVQNIALALGVKAVVLTLGALGRATMWSAVFADVGVAILAVANSMRAYGLRGTTAS
ncbi:MAG: heavy metal translocating P-type ATPase [Bacillota bacterium]|nr:cadmium-translocating P-type ATPase [Bacillota bacterium]